MTVTIKLPSLEAWGELSLQVPDALWSRLLFGEFIQLKGHSWRHPTLNEGFVDIWAFSGGLGGLLSVRMVTPRQIHPKFCGHLRDEYVFPSACRAEQ